MSEPCLQHWGADKYGSCSQCLIAEQQERIAALQSKWILAIGWAYADCCITLDAGGDPRQTEMSDVLRRATSELEEQGDE